VSRGVAILGATGSIGASALAVLAQHPDRFHAVALTARTRGDALAALAARHRPALAVVSEGEVPAGAGGAARWASGREALLEAATHPDADVVVNALVGAAGLEPTLAALRAGKRVALANKESLVCGGPLVLEAARAGGGELVPVDSEHSAILQCLPGGRADGVARLVLTASGGPFRETPAALLASMTPADALRHPTWEMGAKVTVDSATLANKALEVIEAHFLFGVPYACIDAVVHPQSIVHAMVEMVDGSVLAQMGFPTMEIPVLYALTHPERLPYATRRFDPVAAGPLTFEPVDHARFPAFRLGVEAGRAGGTAPAVFNAANEVAVAEFLAGRIPFGGIAEAVEAALAVLPSNPIDSLDAVRRADARARDAAHRFLTRLAPC
jgi:1-deoxy-D-xylulose-5-phosphate reductoisomerase